MGPDIHSVDNVCDTGNGDPLFIAFEPEDWALMNLRWEFSTLAAAFKKDVDDPDRCNIPENHLAFYYQRYFKKSLATKAFGKETNADLCMLIKDVAKIEKDVLVSSLEDDVAAEHFVKLTEELRRARQRRIDAGDETARLMLTPQAVAPFKAG